MKMRNVPDLSDFTADPAIAALAQLAYTALEAAQVAVEADQPRDVVRCLRDALACARELQRHATPHIELLGSARDVVDLVVATAEEAHERFPNQSGVVRVLIAAHGLHITIADRAAAIRAKQEQQAATRQIAAHTIARPKGSSAHPQTVPKTQTHARTQLMDDLHGRMRHEDEG